MWDKWKTFISLLFIFILKILYQKDAIKELLMVFNKWLFANLCMSILVKNHKLLFLVFRSTSFFNSGFRSQCILLPFYPNNTSPAKLTTSTLSVLAMMSRSLKLYVLVWDCAWWWNPIQFYFFCLQFVYGLFRRGAGAD